MAEELVAESEAVISKNRIKKESFMKKKNKVISLIVVLSLCFSFTIIPSNAVSPYAVELPDPDLGGGTSDPYEGQFFIQNCEAQTFMQIDDNASYSEQSQKWSFGRLTETVFKAGKLQILITDITK